ncbi:MAG: peptidylprolyl isomerase [Candidatus Margulisbacteria bacterium]|nr:peptidylprolyl isomerase [Candidatus Margulisiibacteriota bacterium]
MFKFFRSKMKTILIAVAIIFAASMLYGIRGLSGSGRLLDRGGLAKVNGVKVDPERYREILRRLIAQFGGQVGLQDFAFVQNMALEQAIDFTLMLNEAKKKVKVSGREVEMVLDNIVKQENLGSRQNLENTLKRSGLTMGRFKKMVKNEMLVQKLARKIQEGVTVTPDDLREIRASHILVTSETQAREIIERLNKGENFSYLAKQYSKDPGSGAKGGDLGFFTTGMMVKPFEEVAFKLKVGELSDVVPTQFGYHVIKVTDSRLRKVEGEEKDIEKAVLAQKRNNAYRRWMGELKSNAKVEILSPDMRGHAYRYQGKLLEAIEEYKKAVSQNPANPYFHIFLADSFNTIGKTDLAISEYEEAIKMEGGNPDLYIILAEIYKKQDNREEALKQYKRASLVAADNKAMHEKLLKIFEEMKAWDYVSREKAEIARIVKKEKFEESLKGEGEVVQ